MPFIKHLCQNCGALHFQNDLNTIKDVAERVMPGEPMPSGECPDCGAVCHPETIALRPRFKVTENDSDYGNFNIFGETREIAGLDGLYETAINDALDFTRTIAAMPYPGEGGVLKTSDMPAAVERLKAIIMQARTLDCAAVEKKEA